MPTKNPVAQDPGPIEQTETQVDNYRVRPEFFKIRKYSDKINSPFHGQGENDAPSQERSREKFDTGSTRALGNTNSAGKPHTGR